MSSDSNPPRHPHRIPRRRFLMGLSLLGLAGCGSSNQDYIFTNSVNANGGGGGGGGGGEGVAVQGQINLAELGDGPFGVSTAQQPASAVAVDGSFTSRVGGTIPQVVFAVDGNAISAQTTGPSFTLEQVRGLAVYLPDQILDVGAESTAFALVFLSLGVLTPDPAEALDRFVRIRALESFTSLVQLVRAGLSTLPLSALLADQSLQSLRDTVVNEFVASVLPRARRLSNDEYIRQGAVSVERQDGTTEPGQNTMAFENYAYRFATVVREELDAEGNQTRPPVLTDLTGAARLPLSDLTGNRAVFGGANGLSWGTFFTSQVGAPGGAQESFVADPDTVKIRYWIRGVAGGGAFNVPENVRDLDLGYTDYVNTVFFYYFLPLLDVMSGGLAGLALYRVSRGVFDATPGLDSLNKIVSDFAKDPGTVNQYNSLASGTSGDPLSKQGLQSILIDATAAFVAFALVQGQTLAALALAEAAVGAAGVVGVTLAAGSTIALGSVIAFGLGLCAVALATVGAGAGLYNLGRAVEDVLLLPYLAPVEVELESAEYEVVYERVSNPIGDPAGWELTGDVRVNSLGSFAFATSDQAIDLPQASETKKIWLKTNSEDAPLRQIDDVAGLVVDNVRSPSSIRASIALNENDEIAYEGEIDQMNSTQILNFRRPGELVEEVGSFPANLISLAPRDAEGKTIAFLYTGSDMAAIDCGDPLAQLAPLNIAALSGQGFERVNDFAINSSFFAVVIAIKDDPDELADLSTYIQYQYPTTETPVDVTTVIPLSQLSQRPGGWLTINDRGDIARTELEDANEERTNTFLVIERKGKTPLRASFRDESPFGFFKTKMNSDGELFGIGGDGQLYKFTEDRGTFPVSVLDSLPRELDSVTDFDVAGDYLAITGIIDSKPTVLILKKKTGPV